LPVKKWTQDYKEFLQTLLPTEGSGSGLIEDFKEYHTETTVHFLITVTEAQMQKLEENGFEKAFKLRSSLATSNMVFFDKEGKIQKYETEKDIIEQFAEIRLQYYFKRKDYLLERLRQQHEILSEKARFIELVIADTIKVKNRKHDQLVEDLRKNNFRTMHEITDGDDLDEQDAQEDGGPETEEGAKKTKKKRTGGGWDYLLGMPLWSLTKERVQDLQKQVEVKQQELDDLEFTAPEELWEKDLDAILDELDAIDHRATMSAAEEKLICRSGKRAGSSMKAPGKRQKTGSSSAPSTAPVPMVSRGGVANSSSFRDLQDRQLSGASDKFPTLFQDLMKSKLAGPAPQAKPPSFSGGFAQRSVGTGATDSKVLCAGSVVTLHSLGLAEMNGKRGTLRHRDEESGRWEVEVDGQGVKRLKAENLRPLGSKV